MTKTGVFHGEVEGLICPAWSCACINSEAASAFSLGRGHCCTHTGLSVFQVIFMGAGVRRLSVAPRKNPGPFYLVWEHLEAVLLCLVD